jgi:hypothetical protein
MEVSLTIFVEEKMNKKAALEQRRANTLRRNEIKIAEAANALIGLLEQLGAKPGGRTVLREVLIRKIPGYIDEHVRTKNGFKEIPTVNNLAVRLPTPSYLNKNWKAIRETACSYGYFIIWNPPEERPGLRLGTLEEYEYNQNMIQTILIGLMDFYNARAITIVRHEGEAAAVDIIIDDLDN